MEVLPPQPPSPSKVSLFFNLGKFDSCHNNRRQDSADTEGSQIQASDIAASEVGASMNRRGPPSESPREPSLEPPRLGGSPRMHSARGSIPAGQTFGSGVLHSPTAQKVRGAGLAITATSGSCEFVQEPTTRKAPLGFGSAVIREPGSIGSGTAGSVLVPECLRNILMRESTSGDAKKTLGLSPNAADTSTVLATTPGSITSISTGDVLSNSQGNTFRQAITSFPESDVGSSPLNARQCLYVPPSPLQRDAPDFAERENQEARVAAEPSIAPSSGPEKLLVRLETGDGAAARPFSPQQQNTGKEKDLQKWRPEGTQMERAAHKAKNRAVILCAESMEQQLRALRNQLRIMEEEHQRHVAGEEERRRIEAALREALSDSNRRRESLQAELEELRRANAKLEARLMKQSEDAVLHSAQLQAQADNIMQEQLQKVNLEWESKLTDLSAQAQRIAELQGQVRDLVEEHGLLSADAERFRQKEDDWLRRERHLNSCIAEASKRQEEKVAGYTEELAALEMQLREAQQQKDRLAEDSSDLLRCEQELRSRIGDIRREMQERVDLEARRADEERRRREDLENIFEELRLDKQEATRVQEEQSIVFKEELAALQMQLYNTQQQKDRLASENADLCLREQDARQVMQERVDVEERRTEGLLEEHRRRERELQSLLEEFRRDKLEAEKSLEKQLRQVRELEEQQTRFNADVERLRRAQDDWLHRETHLNSCIAEATRAQEDTVAGLQEDLVALKMQLREVHQHKDLLASENTDLHSREQEDLVALKMQLREVNQHKDLLASENTDLHSREQELRRSIEDSRRETQEQVGIEVLRVQEENRRRERELESLLESFRRENEEANLEWQRKFAEQAVRAQCVEDLQKQVWDLEEERNLLSADKERLQRAEAEQLRRDRDLAGAVEDKVAGYKEELAAVTMQLRETQQHKDCLADENANLRRREQELGSGFEKSRRELQERIGAEVRRTQEDHFRRERELQSRLEDFKHGKQEDARRIEDCEEKVKSLEQQLAEQRQADKTAELTRQIGMLSGKFQEAEAESARLGGQLVHLTEACEHYKRLAMQERAKVEFSEEGPGRAQEIPRAEVLERSRFEFLPALVQETARSDFLPAPGQAPASSRAEAVDIAGHAFGGFEWSDASHIHQQIPRVVQAAGPATLITTPKGKVKVDISHSMSLP